MEGAHWSDGLAPHEGNDYATGSQRMYARLPENEDESLTFGGDKLTISSNGWLYFLWYTYPNGTTYHNYPIVINDLVLTGYSSKIAFSDSSNASVASAKYLMQGRMTVTGTLTQWPAIIRLGRYSGNWAYNEMELVGGSAAYLQIETCAQVGGAMAIPDASDGTKISSTAMVGMDFNGDLYGWYGTIMAGTNVAVRIGNEMENGKVVLSGEYSAIGSSGAFGAVLKTLECRNKGILLASPRYGQLYITDSFTRNGRMKVRLFDGADDMMYAERVNVITVPRAANITESDFELEDASDALTLEVEDDGEFLTLSVVNIQPADEFDPSGYVQLFEDDPETFDKNNLEAYSYFFAGNWDDGEKPTDEKDYYVGKEFRFYFLNSGTACGARDVEEGKSSSYYWTHILFRGQSLTLGGTGFFSGPDSGSNGYAMTIPDLRLLSGARFTFAKKDSSVGNPYQVRFGNNSALGITTVTVLANAAWPVVFEGGTEDAGHGGYLFEQATKFLGESTAGIKLVGSPVRTADRGFTAFLGDMSGYYGRIMLGERQNLILGAAQMPGTVEVLSTATEGIVVTNLANEVVSIGSLITHGAVNVTLRGNVKFAVGQAQFGGIVNFICSDFTAGDIVAGRGATAANVRVNGQPVKVFEGTGALYLNDVSELGLEGSGTATDPYVIGSDESRAMLGNAEGVKIYTLPDEALPVSGDNNNTRRDNYINKYRGYFVDNYNVDSQALFMADSGNNAYCDVGYYIRNIGGVDNTFPFWSDELSPHSGANYVVYPEIWGTSMHAKYITVTPEMGDFGGDELLVVAGSELRMEGAGIDTTINKLVLMPGGAVEDRSGVAAESYIRGALYVRGTLTAPAQIICGLHRSVLHFPGVVAAPADGVLRIAADREVVQRPAVQLDGDLSGYKGTIQVGRNAVLKLATDATNATVTCIQFSTGIEVVSAATVRALTLIDGNTITLKAPLKVAEEFFYSGSLTVDMSGFGVAESGTVLIELPAGDVIDQNDFEFTGLPDGVTVNCTGNKAILVGSIGPAPTKHGAAILFK